MLRVAPSLKWPRLGGSENAARVNIDHDFGRVKHWVKDLSKAVKATTRIAPIRGCHGNGCDSSNVKTPRKVYNKRDGYRAGAARVSRSGSQATAEGPSSAWRTGCRGELRGDRISCALSCGHRESEVPNGATDRPARNRRPSKRGPARACRRRPDR